MVNNLELLGVLLIIELPLFCLFFKRFGYRVLGFILLAGFSGAMTWAFTIGCAYEPIWWIKVFETGFCISVLIFSLWALCKESLLRRS